MNQKITVMIMYDWKNGLMRDGERIRFTSAPMQHSLKTLSHSKLCEEISEDTKAAIRMGVSTVYEITPQLCRALYPETYNLLKEMIGNASEAECAKKAREDMDHMHPMFPLTVLSKVIRNMRKETQGEDSI